jgi:anaerobic selenocysteine-containing dehydrogenase
MSVNFDRRSFLKGSAAVSGGLALPNFVVQAAEVASGKKIPVYGTWKDIYKSQWTWDKVVRGTHHLLNCWYQAHCSWDVYVKDGLVYREEQAAEYPQVNAALPDFNPRGCQKGGCFSERMYDPTRISHPLRRVGERGSGKWERVTWKEALDDIADTYLDVTVNEGTDRPSGISARHRSRQQNMAAQPVQPLDAIGQPGHEQRDRRRPPRRGRLSARSSFERSADDYFYSDLILFWAGNPIYTQIPHAHFYTEARIAAPRSSRSPRTTTHRRSSPTCGFRSSPVPTPPWRWRSVARLSREAMSTKPSSKTRPTCRCWCAATRGCS